MSISLFLCQNLSMKNIFNPYLSNDEKDILIEIIRLEKTDAELSYYAELFKLSSNDESLSRQTVAITE